jgi:serine/threonine-protein kinase RsbW
LAGKADKEIELHIPSTLGSEKVAMEKSAEIARNLGFSNDRIEDLKTAVSEACTNAMEHGHDLDANLKVAVTLKPGNGHLEIAIKDKGPGMGEVAKPDIRKKVDKEDHTRGWGLFLIEELMDKVTFETPPEGGNVVRMIIYLD